MNPQEFAIIVAAGTGTRMNASIPKQYMELSGLPILMHTVKAFHTYKPTTNIVLVLPEHDFLYWEELCKQYGFNIAVTLAEGGSTRFESVKNGLAKIKEEDGLVAVHDGVRPLVSQKLIQNAFATAKMHGNAIAAVGLKDSIRKMEGDKSHAVDRDEFRLIQTPQVFDLYTLKKAYREAQSSHFTDDASLVEAFGASIQLIEGDYKNIKITTQEDLFLAACYLNENFG